LDIISLISTELNYEDKFYRELHASPRMKCIFLLSGIEGKQFTAAGDIQKEERVYSTSLIKDTSEIGHKKNVKTKA